MSLWDALGEGTGLQFVDDQAVRLVEEGMRFQKEGQYQDAAKKYESSISIEPNYVDPHHFLANTYSQIERFEDALKKYRIALRLAENFLPEKSRKNTIEQIMANLAKTIKIRSLKKGSYQNASEDFIEICNALKGPPPFYHFLLGMICSEQNLNDEAIVEFEKFLSNDKDGEVTNLAREKIEKIREKQGLRPFK